MTFNGAGLKRLRSRDIQHARLSVSQFGSETMRRGEANTTLVIYSDLSLSLSLSATLCTVAKRCKIGQIGVYRRNAGRHFD